jgi:nucleoside-diphosphate-sugar epimerase
VDPGGNENREGDGAVRILVTGATGFIASHLVPALAADGHEVFAGAHDLDRCPAGPGIARLELDLTDFRTEDLPAVDAVVHLAQANVPFPDGAGALFTVNTASTAALLEHARTSKATTFVYASSASVYGFGDRPWSEDDTPPSSDFYSATKLASERLVGAYAGELSSWCFRFVAPYGPGQRGRMIPRLIANVEAGRPITLNDGGRPRMNPIFVDDVVDAVQAALSGTGSQVVNVAGDDVVSIKELAELIGRVVGRDPVFEEGNSPVAGDLVAVNRRLHDLLGRQKLVTLDAGLSRLVQTSGVV